MAHVLKGYLYGLSTDHEATPIVKACHEAAARLPATGREKAAMSQHSAIWRRDAGTRRGACWKT